MSRINSFNFTRVSQPNVGHKNASQETERARSKEMIITMQLI